MVPIQANECKCCFVNSLQIYGTTLQVPEVMACVVHATNVCPGTYYSLKEIS